MPNTICDLRFCFIRNPFSTTQNVTSVQSIKKEKLMKYIYSHPDDFVPINPILNIKYIHHFPQGKIKSLCGVKNVTTHDLLNDYKYLARNVKEFIAASGIKLSNEVKQWVDDSEVEQISPKEVVEQAPQAIVTEPSDEVPIGTDILPFLDKGTNENVEKSVRIDWNYDVSSDKKLDYDEVCTLCINKAKTFNTKENLQDPNVIAIENKRRRELLNKITRYRRHREIQATFSDEDISQMSLDQLETFAMELETRFGQLKLKDVSQRILNTSGRMYDMVFPRGIPIGSGRHINFNGFGDGIIKEMYTPATTVGLAYDNIMRKHNINISDELTVITAILELAVKNINITKDKSKDEDAGKVDDEDEDDEDEDDDEVELQEVE